MVDQAIKNLVEYGVWDGELPGDGELSGGGELPGVGEVPRDRELPGDGKWNGFPVVNHFHRWVRGRLMDGGCPEAEIRAFLDRCEGSHSRGVSRRIRFLFPTMHLSWLTYWFPTPFSSPRHKEPTVSW